MISQKENLLCRTLLGVVLIILAAALRLAPHPWNFAPIGSMALFSGAVIRDRRFAFLVPLFALAAGNLFIGFHKLLPFVYASFLANVVIGLWLHGRRTTAHIGVATLIGAVQFFFVTTFGVWWLLGTYPRTIAGLTACYIAGIPLFWNTLAGDTLYAFLLFSGFALAEHMFPAFGEPVPHGARQ